MNATLRRATRNDLKSLSQIYTISYNAADIGEHWSDEKAYMLLSSLYEDQPDLFFIVEVDDIVAGAITATVRPWWDGNHLFDGELFLHPNFQKHGLGVLLVEKLFNEAKEKYDVSSWDTFTHIIHKHPLSWYKKLGFEEIKEWTMITGDVKKVLGTIATLKK